MQYVTYNQLSQNQLNQMQQMLSRCFHIRNITLTPEYKYLIAEENNIIISMTAVKYDASSSSASLWNVCATSYGKITHATKRLLEFGLPQILQNDQNKCWLVLEFENPYWVRALSLYTSLGFINIITSSNQFQKIISQEQVEKYLKKGIILFTTFDIFYKIHDEPNKMREEILKTRNKVDEIRKNKYKGEYGGVGLTREMAQFGKQLITLNKEYAGYLTVDQNYDFNGVGNLTGGNPIYSSKNFPAFSEIYSTSKHSIFHFHTHPLITNENNNLSFNPPSISDINFLFEACKLNLLRGYIFSTNGIFAYALSKYNQCISTDQSIINQYKAVLDSLLDIRQDLRGIFGSWIVNLNDDQIENLLIDYYIESVGYIEYNEKPVFDIKYWPYSFLEKNTIIDSFFISKKVVNIGNITKSSLFFNQIDQAMPLFQAIKEGEETSCSEGYISFLLGARYTNENDIKLKNCLPYSYIDLDPLFKKYLDNDSQILDLVKQGLPYKRIVNNIRVYM